MLTVDLGNSRAKVRVWRLQAGEPPLCLEAADFADEADLSGWLERRSPAVAALSSVAPAERTARVRALLAARAGELHDGPSSGLVVRCRAPERVGRDRLYAARGALAELARSCLVVDAGTALTVDAVRLSSGGGEFLGGAIAPGPELLARALEEGTANLPRVRPRPGASALGRDTEEALLAGIALGFRGAAAALVEEVAREAGLEDAPAVLTGGARAFLLEPRPFTARALHVRPDLVHRGLIEAVLDSSRAARGASRA